jgi:hypothetical protein
MVSESTAWAQGPPGRETDLVTKSQNNFIGEKTKETGLKCLEKNEISS